MKNATPKNVIEKPSETQKKNDPAVTLNDLNEQRDSKVRGGCVQDTAGDMFEY